MKHRHTHTHTLSLSLTQNYSSAVAAGDSLQLPQCRLQLGDHALLIYCTLQQANIPIFSILIPIFLLTLNSLIYDLIQDLLTSSKSTKVIG